MCACFVLRDDNQCTCTHAQHGHNTQHTTHTVVLWISPTSLRKHNTPLLSAALRTPPPLRASTRCLSSHASAWCELMAGVLGPGSAPSLGATGTYKGRSFSAADAAPGEDILQLASTPRV